MGKNKGYDKFSNLRNWLKPAMLDKLRRECLEDPGVLGANGKHKAGSRKTMHDGVRGPAFPRLEEELDKPIDDVRRGRMKVSGAPSLHTTLLLLNSWGPCLAPYFSNLLPLVPPP